MSDHDSVVDATLKKLAVPQLSTDVTKHDKYLADLRGHLHLLPETVAGFRHDMVLDGIPQRFVPPPPGYNNPANPTRGSKSLARCAD